MMTGQTSPFIGQDFRYDDSATASVISWQAICNK